MCCCHSSQVAKVLTLPWSCLTSCGSLQSTFWHYYPLPSKTSVLWVHIIPLQVMSLRFQSGTAVWKGNHWLWGYHFTVLWYVLSVSRFESSSKVVVWQGETYLGLNNAIYFLRSLNNNLQVILSERIIVGSTLEVVDCHLIDVNLLLEAKLNFKHCSALSLNIELSLLSHLFYFPLTIQPDHFYSSLIMVMDQT